jgi:small subunit ribosomal protein S1
LRTPTGLADLALAYAALHPQPSELESIALLLGLDTVGRVHLPPSVSPPILSLAEAPPAAAIIDVLAAPLIEEEDDDEEYSSVPVSPTRWKIEESKIWGPITINKGFPKKHPVRAQAGEYPKATSPPAGIADSKAWPLPPKESRQYRSPKPLIPVGIRRSFLRDIASSWGPTGDVDTVRLADIIARGKWLRTIPRIKRRSVERPPMFLVDVSQPMTPYLDEANDLVGMAKSILGCSASSITWTSGPPELNHDDDTRPSPAVSPGDTLIVLSLLGLGTSGIEQEAWLKFAQTASCRGVRLIAISPALPAHWAYFDARRYWSFIPWMCHSSTRRISSPDDVAQLAALLSVVVNPDPDMVRDARLRFFPNTEPYLESMLIQSRWVAAAFCGRLVMHCDKSGYLRQLLLRSPHLLKQAQILTTSGSGSNVPEYSPVTSAEKLWADALSSDLGADERINAGLAGLIKALHENQDDESFARFAYSVLERLPPNKLDSELGRLAALMVRCGLRQQLDEGSLGLATKHHSWLYPKSTVIGLAWNGRKLFLKDRPRSGDALIELPETPRRHIRINWGEHLGAEWRYFLRGRRNIVVAPELPDSVTTLSGQTYTLTQPDEDDIWRTIERSLKAGEIIKGRLISMVTNPDGFVGFLIDIGITAFLPASQFANDGFVEAPEGWLGQFVEVIVIEADRYVRLIIVSRSRALAAMAKEEAKIYLASLIVGERLYGCVIAVTTSVILVRVGAVTGKIPLYKSFKQKLQRLVHLVKIGDIIACKVVSVDPTNQLLELRLNRLSQDRWLTLSERFPIGAVIIGTVKTLISDGAFIELEPGFDGFVDKRNITGDIQQRLSDILTNGQKIEVTVIQNDIIKQHIALEIKQLPPNPWDNIETKYPIGSRVKGKVVNLMPDGVLVKLDPGVNGFVHATELSWSKLVAKPSDVLKQDEEIEAVVLGINRDEQKISLSIRQLESNPWDNIKTKYSIGSRVKGKVVSLVPYGAFVQLEPGVEGLVHVTELSWTKRVAKPSDVLKQDQEIEAVVLGINREEQKISLGIRQLESNPWDIADQKYPVGTKVKGKVRNLTSYGAFVELEEGIDGMVHVSDMSWTRKINHPSEMLKKGDEVEATVLEVDRANQRIALGMMQLEIDPWEKIETLYKVGDLVQGKVTKLASFGVFVGLQHEIDGLVHISQISEERVEKIKNTFKVGQDVSARVVKIDRNERHIGLSMLLK